MAQYEQCWYLYTQTYFHLKWVMCFPNKHIFIEPQIMIIEAQNLTL